MQVAGVNIEDGRGDHLAAATEHANLLRAFKDAAPAIFLTARIDTHWLKLEQRTTIERASATRTPAQTACSSPDSATTKRLTRSQPPSNFRSTCWHKATSSASRASECVRVSTGSLLFRGLFATADRPLRYRPTTPFKRSPIAEGQTPEAPSRSRNVARAPRPGFPLRDRYADARPEVRASSGDSARVGTRRGPRW